LYARVAASTLDDRYPRIARLEWASENLGRRVDSFKQLTKDEARRLIDVLKVSLGQAINVRPYRSGRIRSREVAQAAGTSGRRNVSTNAVFMARPEDISRIEQAIERLGWTRDSFNFWLNSKYSPIRRNNISEIHTVADANRVWWALKSMLKKAGLWRDEAEPISDLRKVS
jgi:hypothetical protein